MGTTVPHRSHPGVPTEFRIPVPWGHLAALSWGPVDGSPVICLHGWMDNANSFQRLVPLLPSDRRYIALDFSGHGHSSHLAKGSRYDFNNYMIEVCRAVQALNYCQVSIIGHSMGGIIGTMFACIFPDMVENLILLDVYGFFPNSPEHLIKQTRNVITNHLKLEHKHGPKVYSPEGALSRLLEANTALTEDSGRIILERGTKEVPGGKRMESLLRKDLLLILTIASPMSYAVTWKGWLHVQLQTVNIFLDCAREYSVAPKRTWDGLPV